MWYNKDGMIRRMRMTCGTIFKRTKACQNSLVKWLKATFKQTDMEICKLKQHLNRLINHENHPINWEEVKKVQQDIDALWHREEVH